jgi:hypothetical protein
VIGLIGSGQEIHIGEEAGLSQWRTAVEGSARSNEWEVHGPPSAKPVFAHSSVEYRENAALNLDRELRFHAASDLHEFVNRLLHGGDAAGNADLAGQLRRDGYRLRLTRDLGAAKQHLRERYSEDADARFGLLASSRDRDLERFGVENGYNATKQVRFGPWYCDSQSAPGGRSCRHLVDCVTEFGAQGLELDAALLAWGTDFLWEAGEWSSARARRYQRPGRVKDAHQLRMNAYRVLLTRGRDGTIVFAPPMPELDATSEYLRASGFGSI